jgi:hypothetical protein
MQPVSSKNENNLSRKQNDHKKAVHAVEAMHAQIFNV